MASGRLDPRMMWETSQRNSVITGGNEGPFKPVYLSTDSRGLGSPAKKVEQKRDKSESTAAETILKDLSMTARGRFQQNVDAVEATEKDLWGHMGELPHFHEKDRIQG